MNFKKFKMNGLRIYFGIFLVLMGINAMAGIQDSIGIMEQNGKKMILHQVGKETLYSIARRYNVTVNDIISFNPEVEKGLKLGQKILIPLVEKQQMPSGGNYVFHKVEPNQTLYAISKKYNVKVEDIKRWNNMTSNDMKVGSLIIVGEKATEAPIEESSSMAPTTSSESTVKSEPKPTVQKQISKTSGYDKIVEKGSAEPYETADGGTFYYALHKAASIGSILHIANEANGTSIFARVVGKLPVDASSGVVVRLTKIAMERLLADKTFRATVEYVP
jgi:LysM repeat protein